MLTIEDIEKAISAAAPGSWTPGETIAWRRLESGGTNSGLFGLRISDQQRKLKPAADDFDTTVDAQLPPRIDWRTEDGGRLAHVRDQGDCGACVAFATTAVVEADSWIRSGARHALSEAELFHCNGGSCDDGWGLAEGLVAATKGMASLDDARWIPKPKCKGAQHIIKVASYAEHVGARAKKRAVARGPVVAGMAVYEDFSAYQTGIYRHVAGAFVANHAVCIVGYDDAEQHWILRNSWGNGWGEAGYCNIAYGECSLGDYPFYSCETESV